MRRAEDAGAHRAHAEDRKAAEELIDVRTAGTGPPLDRDPGLQGRWEWMRPALRALRRRCRTISYSLCRRHGSPRCHSIRRWVRATTCASSTRCSSAPASTRAAFCGVSFGGFIALRYAATRPERVSALVLVSVAGAGLDADRRASSGTSRGPGCRRRRSSRRRRHGSGRRFARRCRAGRRGSRSASGHGARVAAAPDDPVADGGARSTMQQAMDFARGLRRASRRRRWSSRGDETSIGSSRRVSTRAVRAS